MRVGSPPITFVYHLGMHCTDEDMLVQSLMKNAGFLQKRHVIVPRPRRYRVQLGEFASKHRGKLPPEAEQAAFITDVLMGYAAERVVFTHPNMFSMPHKIFDGGRLYGKAAVRASWLRGLYPENPTEFFLGIRNPATFIPAAMRQSGIKDLGQFLAGVPALEVRWSEMVADLAAENPGCPITVWCNEDTPLIWPALLREIADVGPLDPMMGEFDVLMTIIKPEGFERMRTYLQSHPPQSEMQRRRVAVAFLDKFAIDDAIVEEIDLPGWTPELVDEISRRYEDDVFEIGRMPGVTLITT